MIRIVRVLSLLLLSISSVSFAQNLGTGLYAFGSFDSRGFDSINLGNLNAHFEIPIVSKQGRGLNFNYSIAYDGLIWSPSNSAGTGYWQPDSNWGFHGQLLGGAYTGYLTYTQGIKSCPQARVSHPPPGATMMNYVYHDAYGKNHHFNYIYNSCPNWANDVITGGGGTSDGSGLSFGGSQLASGISDGLIHARDGSIINAPVGTTGGSAGNITDSNGNKVTNNGNGTFTDTLGVTALTITGSATPASPLSFTYPVTHQADNSAIASAVIYYKTYTVQTNFQCPGITEYGAASTNLVDHIALADGRTYSFAYEATLGVSGAVTGRLASVTLPTGGVISYTYSGGCSGINSDGSPATLARATSDGTKTYSRAISGTTSTTSVTDEAQNHATYTFINNADGFWYETERKIWQGPASGTPMQDRVTQYNNRPSITQLPAAITQTDVLESFNGGSQSQLRNVYNTSGLLTQTAQMVPGGGGTTLKSSIITYGAVGQVTAYRSYDSANTVISASTYGYDESTPTVTSGVPQHVAGAATRGNQTSAHIVTGSTNIDTTATYYDTGVPIATTTPNGTTQYSYDSTQTFATTTTLPTPSSGVSLATSASYDPQSGAVLSMTGMNPGQTSQVTQYDRLLRPVTVSLPIGSITYNYESFNQTGLIQPMGNGQSADTETLIDAYGRKSRVAVYNGQSSNGWYQVDYCYDATGNLSFQSTRYQGTGFIAPKQCSGSGATYLYDALGRMTSSTNADGPTTYQYFGRAVKVTDVNNVQKITQYDLLGRISGVCEISSGTSLVGSGSPVSCGMDIAGTGFTTGYTYTLASHTTTVAQGAQSRTFQTDAAGRTTSVTEPERGTTSYSYEYNGTGLAVTRTRPQANQTNPAVAATTTTQYDSLGRPVTVFYSDGITPSKYFYYDNNPYVSWSSETTTNLKGNFAIASTSNPGALLSSSLFSYDATGHVTTMWQCAPSICGTPNQAGRPALGLAYDFVGNLINEFDGASGNISYGRSPAGEVTSIANLSYTDPVNTPNLVSNVINGPNGPVTYDMGNGVSTLRTYDSLGRLNGGWLCPTSGKANCYNAQMYGFYVAYKGTQAQTSCDTINNSQCLSYGYDEFNRLTALSGPQSFSYVYDRYGNRWSQNVTQGSGPAPSVSFDVTSNRINSSGYGYDAAGNLTNDGFHSYTYDAEGNVLQVDGGSTAQYVYDALNRRVRSQTASATYEYLYDYAGRRTSSWLGPNNFGNEGRIYWGGTQIAYRAWNGTTYFDHQDWIGTERMRTDHAGAIASSYKSLPWGDGSSYPVDQGPNQDNLHFAQLDHDSESSTDHALFRQYSNLTGRWHSPDPYSGSYNFSDPQSLNRYAYVTNNPLTFADPIGLRKPPPPGNVGGGLPPFIDGNMFNPPMFSGSGEFAQFDTVSSPDGGTYNYSQNVWNNIASSDSYNIVNSDGTITSASDAGVGGNVVAWSMAGLMFSPIPTSQTSAANNPKPPKSAFSGSVSFPIVPGITGSIPVAVTNNTTCVGLGVGVGSPGWGVNGGIVTTPANNIVDVLEGASVSFAAQSGFLGVQWSHNSSGIAAGNSIGTPGISLTVSYSVCF